MEIKGVFFDMDGVVIDSSRLWNDIITELSAKYNLDLMVVESAAMKNLSTKEAMKLVLESMGMYSDALLGDILEDIDVMYEKGLRPLTSVIGGIPEILQLLGRKSIARVIVSNSTRKQVAMVLRYYGLEDSFDYSVASDDVSKGKPDAEPYLKALQLTGLAPEEALVVEDSDTGVSAAGAASIECIKVSPNSGFETHGILVKRLELQDSGYMKVFINHSPVECKAGTSVASLLSEAGIGTEGIAVAVDNKVVPKSGWEARILEEGAKVTVIRAVCGG